VISRAQKRIGIVAVNAGRADRSDAGRLDLLAESEKVVPRLRLGPTMLTEKRAVVENRPARVAERQAVRFAVDEPGVERARQEGVAPARVAFPVRTVEKRREVAEFAGARQRRNEQIARH